MEADKKQKLEGISKLQRKIEKSPFVEKELNALLRDLDSAQTKYSDISNKLMEARVTGELEGSQQAGRVSIASSAYLPSEPYKPNRLLIIALGLVNAFLISCIFIAVREGMDNTVRTTEQIKQITGIPVLSSVSYIFTNSEKRTKRLKIFGWFFLIIIVGAAGLFCVNQYIVNLNELWSIVLERIKMIA